MSGNKDNELDNDNNMKCECDACHDHDDDDDDDGNEYNFTSASDDSETGSVNNSHIDFEERQSYIALAMLTCVEDILPMDSLGIRMFRKHMDNKPKSKRNKFSVDALQAECLNIYDDEKVRAKKALKYLDAQITLSVDVLRCPSAGQYLCLTAHFIAVDWYLRNWVICFRPINRSLDDDCSYGAVKKCITEWDIGEKVSGITVENCWFNDEGVDEVKELVQEKRKLPFGGQMFRLYCCADLFKLMVQDAFEPISKIMRKVDEYMNFGKPIYTWNNAYTNLKEALEFEAKGEWNKDVYEIYDKLTADEWKKVEDICKLLESLYNAATAVFEAKHHTANIYLPKLQELHASLTQASVGSDSFISPIAKKMLERLDKYMKNMFLVLAIATVMDPRCKMKYLEFSFSRKGANDGSSGLTSVLTTIQSLYDDYLTNLPQSRKRKADSVARNAGEDSSRQVSDAGSEWLQEYKQFVEADNRPIKSELDLYLADGVLPWNQDFDVLSWWRAEGPKYPVLSMMARDFLAIPVSVLTSNDAYFTIEREISSRLASLQSDVMNAVMCSRSWCPPDTKSKICSLVGDTDFLVDLEFAEDVLSCL